MHTVTISYVPFLLFTQILKEACLATAWGPGKGALIYIRGTPWPEGLSAVKVGKPLL